MGKTSRKLKTKKTKIETPVDKGEGADHHVESSHVMAARSASVSGRHTYRVSSGRETWNVNLGKDATGTAA
jgi:hypothetical protein